MGAKIYSIYVEEEVVNQAKELWQKKYYRKKLSPLIEKLLREWCEEEVKCR